jgi:hypothetical protein
MRYILINEQVRQNALAAVAAAPDNWVVSVSEKKRSEIANSKMWAMLHDVAKASPEGRQWTPETWKTAFMHYLGHQVMFAEGLDGSGPFPIGFRSSRLTVPQMSDLITCIYKYGDEHGVIWSDTDKGGFTDLVKRSGDEL